MNKWCRSSLLPAVFLLALSTLAHPLDTWVRRSPAPTGASLSGITYGNGRFVASGDDSAAVSEDGTNWNWFQLPGSSAAGIGYGDGKYVIAGYGGDIFVSDNATNWIRHSTTYAALFNATWGNGKYVVVGDGIRVSSDAESWTTLSSPGRLYGVVYGGDQFIAVGFDGRILRSTNGVNWSQVHYAYGVVLQDVAYGEGNYVAVGLDGQSGYSAIAFRSTDGINWHPGGSVPNQAGGTVTYGQGSFVAAGQGGIAYSWNGASWLPGNNALNMAVGDMMYTNGLFVGVGLAGQIGISTNSGNWQKFTFSPAPTLKAVHYGRDRWVAVGEIGTVETSPDGVDWNALSSGVTNTLLGVTCSSNLWVIVGQNGQILSSEDATNWNAQVSPTTATLSAVACHDGQFVGVGSAGTIVSSLDGKMWAQKISNTTQGLNGICYGAHQWLAVGNGGTVSTCSNGVGWSTTMVPSLGDVKTVVFSEGQFYACCYYGRYARVATSTNGSNWQVLPENSPFRYAANGNGGILMGGGASIRTSAGGTSWESRSLGVTRNMNAMAFGQNRFVAVGDAGQIYQSGLLGPRLTIGVGHSGRLALQIHGHAGAFYEIQGATNPSAWSPAATGIQDNDLFEWEDSITTEMRLYRVIYK